MPNFGCNAHYAISIDGTEEIHDTIRGKGVYSLLRQNAFNAIKNGIPVAVIYCINALNIDCISGFLDEWHDKGLIGVVFTMYTPIEDNQSSLVLNETQTRRVVGILKKMKQK